jgi:hypothetical protein
VEPLRHRRTKGAETDMFNLQPPRHISTLPRPCQNGFMDVGPAARTRVSQAAIAHENQNNCTNNDSGNPQRPMLGFLPDQNGDRNCSASTIKTGRISAMRAT